MLLNNFQRAIQVSVLWGKKVVFTLNPIALIRFINKSAIVTVYFIKF